MPGSSFVHLHQHTEFSMLDGASKIDDVIQAAVRDGQPALGITDHGNMYGVVQFYKACKKAGIVPVLGEELYMAEDSRLKKAQRRGRVDDDTGGESEGGGKLYYHLTALAETTQGYHNLVKLSSEAFLTGYHYKPRVDWELLEQYHDGLIVTTGCLGGLVLQALLNGNEKLALERAARLQDIFGKDNLFVELQDHGIPEQHRTNPMLVKLAQQIGAPLLATNDSHYVTREAAEAHDALLCIQTNARIADQKRFRFTGTEHYLKSAAEMRALFADFPEACDSSLLIAERARADIQFGMNALPEPEVPAQFSGATYAERSAKYLRHLVHEGARERYGDPIPTHVQERLDFELSVIDDMGFNAYFLVVWDLVRHAKSSGFRVGPGRGSAAGSCVSYCLNIVELDPIQYGLYFERFLNPGRREMPDIDLDFSDLDRDAMIRYASNAYGWDHVGQIVTFGRIKARAAVRDAARVLGFPYLVGDRIAKAMPPLLMGRDTPLRACLEEIPGHEEGYAMAAGIRDLYNSDADSRRVMDVALGLEGLERSDGIHAAAVVITKEPLTEYLPIQRKVGPNQEPDEAPIVTQYEMHTVADDLGLLKMDFLGLRNLSVIERALQMIERNTGQRPPFDKDLDLRDPATFELLQRSDTIGVFQLEGDKMRELVRRLKPETFEDVCALIALYRPGPMAANMHNDYADRKNGRKPIEAMHEDMKELLKETYALMIYQEQMMRIAQHYAGYTLQEADHLRKACGKKIREVMAAERTKFVAGCEAQGFGKALGNQLFDMIEPFSDYSFNKSHAFGYGMVTYQTAWLKANYPTEYLASLLTSVADKSDKMAFYLSEVRRQRIELMVPDVNRSESAFTPIVQGDNRQILFGLSAVRGVGPKVVEQIVSEREAHGSYVDFYDFCMRMDSTVLNKRVLEALILAGAFDSMGYSRLGLQQSYAEVIQRAGVRKQDDKAGIVSLFATLDDSSQGDASFHVDIPTDEFPTKLRLQHEKTVLGLYVSGHPLRGYEKSLAAQVSCSSVEISSRLEQQAEDSIAQELTLGGLVVGLQTRRTKRGELMATFSLEDLDGSVEVVVFPRLMVEVQDWLANDQTVLVTGRLDAQSTTMETGAMTAKILSSAVKQISLHPDTPELLVSLSDEAAGHMVELRQLLERYPGDTPVILEMSGRRYKLPHSVQSCEDLSLELKQLLGG